LANSKEKALPLIAIVGRPNVGKSTLFNRLIGQRRAIVGDEPGITRDRIYGEANWRTTRFAIVDTGGIVPDDDATIPSNIFKQAGVAIEEASALVWVVDVRKGVTPQDEELARLLRQTGKRVFVAANKADAARLEAEAADFYRFGFEEVFPISAEHGNGIGDMLDALEQVLRGSSPTVREGARKGAKARRERMEDADRMSALPAEEALPLARELNLAIVGRPNVGKSSLLNRLLGEERAIVSPVAGTTRDTVDTLLETPEQAFRIIDTAGIRRKGKTLEMAEKLSVVMARKSLERADVAIILLDAEQGIAALDAAIAGYASEAGCSIIIALNKWDLLESKDTHSAAAFERKVREQMKFLAWAPVVTISALVGQRVQKLLPLAVRANEARSRRIPTSQLNQFYERMIERSGIVTAKSHGRSQLHVQYITQTSVRPPTFVVFTAGGKGGLHFSFLRHLENRLREEFDFFGTPIKFVERHKKKRAR
jgi:GTP-binding protein